MASSWLDRQSLYPQLGSEVSLARLGKAEAMHAGLASVFGGLMEGF